MRSFLPLTGLFPTKIFSTALSSVVRSDPIDGVSTASCDIPQPARFNPFAPDL